MYSVYFSVHYDRERDEERSPFLAGAMAWPEKSCGELKLA